MERIVPLIGASVVGPLGIQYLPRMWLKCVLSAAGMLWEGYFDHYKGFIQVVVDRLGLDPDAWFAFLKTVPTYLETEAYVRLHGRTTDADAISALNAYIETFVPSEEIAAPLLAHCGLDASVRLGAVILNIDDPYTFHEELIRHRNDHIEPLIPMISSSQVGVLGIPHLPRLWVKAFLSSLNALPAGWKTGTDCGLDAKLAEMIDLDLPAACAFIESDLPSYLEFEKWLKLRVATFDESAQAALMEEILSLEKPEDLAAAELLECGAPGLGLRGVVLINDLVDWKYMHDHIVARRAALA
jgi:hypothetical protein